MSLVISFASEEIEEEEKDNSPLKVGDRVLAYPDFAPSYRKVGTIKELYLADPEPTVRVEIDGDELHHYIFLKCLVRA